MKKMFYVLLISIFCIGLVSCANTYTKIIKSNTTNTVFDEISEASGSTLEDSTIEESSITVVNNFVHRVFPFEKSINGNS